MRGEKNTSNPKHILFVAHKARIRESKLAFTAKSCGYRITLAAHKIDFNDDSNKYFDEHYIMNNSWQYLKLIRKINPDIIHLFVGYTNAHMLPVLRFSPVPVVYDPYDCLRGMLHGKYKHSKLEEWAEKYCIQNADHLCSRSLEPLHLKRKYNYSLPPSTYFPDYCWKTPKVSNIDRTCNRELHVVYAGGINPEDKYSSEDYGFAQYIGVGRELARQKIHLHLYPANPIPKSDFSNFYSLYLKEAEKNQYFHIYEKVPHSELMSAIEGYDAGMHLNIFSKVESYENQYSVTREKLKYSTANKIFDYIEVGLPVIIFDNSHISGLIKHYGTGISVKTDRDVRQCISSKLSRTKAESMNSATLKYHAHRLNKMYLSLIEKGG